MAPEDTLAPEQLAAAKRALDQIGQEQEIALAVVSGSVAFGLSHAMSDIDLYIVPKTEPTGRIRVIGEGGYSVQPNIVSLHRFEELETWATSSREPLSQGNRSYIVSDAICKDAIRLARGRIIHADDSLAQRLARFDWDFMARRVMSREAIQASQHIEDIEGSLTAGDLDTALLATRLALTHAGEALLAACRDLYVGPKFLAKRLRRISHLGPIVDQLLAALDVACTEHPLALVPNTGAVERARILEERAALTTFTIALAHLNGWSSPLAHAPQMSWGSKGPRRSAWYTTLRFDDGIGLAGQDRGFRLNEAAIRLWLSLDGTRNRTTLLTETPEVEAALQQLADAQLVETPG